MKGFEIVLLVRTPVINDHFVAGDKYEIKEWEYPKNVPLPREGESVIINEFHGIVNHIIHKLKDGMLRIEIILV